MNEIIDGKTELEILGEKIDLLVNSSNKNEIMTKVLIILTALILIFTLILSIPIFKELF